MIRTVKLSVAAEIGRLWSQLGYPVTREQVRPRVERLINDKDNAIFVHEVNKESISG